MGRSWPLERRLSAMTGSTPRRGLLGWGCTESMGTTSAERVSWITRASEGAGMERRGSKGHQRGWPSEKEAAAYRATVLAGLSVARTIALSDGKRAKRHERPPRLRRPVGAPLPVHQYPQAITFAHSMSRTAMSGLTEYAKAALRTTQSDARRLHGPSGCPYRPRGRSAWRR